MPESEVVAIVVGASGSVGGTLASSLAAVPGWAVTATSRSIESLSGLSSTVDKQRVADLTLAEGVSDLEALTERVLVNRSAHAVLALPLGLFPGLLRLDEHVPDVVGKLIGSNCTAVVNALAATLPVLAKCGRADVFLFGSHAIGQGYPLMAPFIAAKAFIQELTEILQTEWGGKGIRSWCLNLGTVDSAAERQLLPHANPENWISPEEIADLVVELTTGPRAIMNGGVIPVYRHTLDRYETSFFDRIGRGLSE